MKLDPSVMRTMEAADFRVMAAVETGMQDHYLVPMPLITSNAGLRHGGAHKILSSLLRDKLLSHEVKGIDGYRLTNAGYDILALHNLKARGFVAALGQRIGTGKESDIYLGASPTGKQIVLKFHRLGRTSFRNVKNKRDYFNKASKGTTAHSWLFLSRLSALKEFAFLRALHDVAYPTPVPIGQNRHVICMSLVRGVPLYQIFPKQLSLDQARDIYQQAVALASRLCQVHGLVHCDLNEFNLLVDLSGIQAIATNDAEDPYVRHSGQSVAPDMSVGALSKPVWEQTLEEEHATPDEPLPQPLALLPDGEPKPIVTLIDFPQMISTQHPNAEEYFDRDIACLRRFFEMKLQCHIPDDETPSWRDVYAEHTETRLDEELHASGFSEFESQHLELYYFNNNPHAVQNTSTIASVVDEDLNEDQDDSDEVESENDDAELPRTEIAASTLLVEAETNHFSEAPDNDASSLMTGRLDSLSVLELQGLSREELKAVAKERVRRQLDDQRKKSRNKGAFRKRNSNKTYVKGKRVIGDSF